MIEIHNNNSRKHLSLSLQEGAYRNSFFGTLGNPIDLVGSIRQGFEFDVRVACLSICVNCRRNMSCALPSYRGLFLRRELMLFVVVIKRTYRQTNYS